MTKHAFWDIVVPVEEDNLAIGREESICIKCGMCKNICVSLSHVSDRYELEDTNDKAICTGCGQCTVVCPTGALKIVNVVDQIKNALADDNKIVTISMSPAVRVSIGEAFGMKSGINLEKKIVALWKKLGADYVFDTTFGADLTIMEEASELVERFKHKGVLPQFTSCCPAWVNYVETFYPEFIPNLSTTKSPIAMQGAMIKLYFAKTKHIHPSNIVNIALVPCTAKKMEIRESCTQSTAKEVGNPNLYDMDYAITVRELVEWMKEMGIDITKLEDMPFDHVLGKGSGAGVIFGNSGGVMEAAIRTTHFLLTGENMDIDHVDMQSIRGLKGCKRASIPIGEHVFNVAVVHTTREASKLLDRIKSGKEKDLHFVEVMACPGGCISGAGQPRENLDDSVRQSRIDGLYQEDKSSPIRFSHENNDVKSCYEQYLGKPLSEQSHKVLHRSFTDKNSNFFV